MNNKNDEKKFNKVLIAQVLIAYIIAMAGFVFFGDSLWIRMPADLFSFVFNFCMITGIISGFLGSCVAYYLKTKGYAIDKVTVVLGAIIGAVLLLFMLFFMWMDSYDFLRGLG